MPRLVRVREFDNDAELFCTPPAAMVIPAPTPELFTTPPFAIEPAMEMDADVPELFRVPLFEKVPVLRTTREAPAALVSPPELFRDPATVSTDAVVAFWIGPDDDAVAAAATVNLPLLRRWRRRSYSCR